MTWIDFKSGFALVGALVVLAGSLDSRMRERKEEPEDPESPREQPKPETPRDNGEPQATWVPKADDMKTVQEVKTSKLLDVSHGRNPK
ncbi:hypothetical protein RBB75_09855 [Tunturibacter empetritectus]|uniref:Uncharacterized protein n=1 Tax=Tunturiibacter empetritectus TaxID=3069691 RepID=A0AAU7ZJ30_9BACT